MDQHSLKSITRGGQTFLHGLRMINQVLNKVLLWTLPVAISIGGIAFCLLTAPYDRYVGGQWLWAKAYLFFDGEHHQQHFRLPDGKNIEVYSAQIPEAVFVQDALDRLLAKAEVSAIVAFISYLFFITGTLIWLKRHGDKQSAEKLLKGDCLGTAKDVKKLLKKHDKLSTLILGKEHLPLPRHCEMQHFLFHGSTGSGKSTLIKALMDYVRSQGDRAIIYDKSCNLVKEFFTDSDILLNSFDRRSANWHLWAECRDKADFETLAAALIPMPPSNQDPFWVNAARTIFAAAAYRMRREKHPTVLSLLRYLLTSDIGTLQSLLRGTEAETLMSEKTEKTAISIKSVLATYLKSLCTIKEGEQAFSIRHWVQNDRERNWLFISSLGDKHESLKPLITAWLDIAVNALLSLSENPERRIWIILDELTSLQQLPYLTAALSEARKFGGCFVVGIQSYAQLAKVYGQEGGREISSLLNTRFMFRIPDPEIAQWSARNLGESIIEEVREGISYGANTLRDGVSVNRAERTKPVVSISEMMSLRDLQCFVRLSGEYPIVKLEIPYLKRTEIAVPFLWREFEQDDLRNDVVQLADQFAAQNVPPVPQILVQENQSSGPVQQKKNSGDKNTGAESEQQKLKQKKANKINKTTKPENCTETLNDDLVY